MAIARRIVAEGTWRAPDVPSAAQLGGKASGLLSLPAGRTPPFLVLGRAFLDAWREAAGSARLTFDASHVGDREALTGLLASARGITGAEGMIVRSNAPNEITTEARGRYTSLDSGFDEDEIFEAIDDVLAQSSSDPVYAILQVRLSRRVWGHLSNERRVAERASQWLIEEEGRRDAPVREPRRIRVGEGEPLSLNIEDRPMLDAALRQLAWELHGAKAGRAHCEWVWDGTRIWVVQLDRAQASRGGPVADYLGTQDVAPRGDPAAGLRMVRRLRSDEAGAWSKLGRRYVMEQVGLPVAPIYFLPATALNSEIAAQAPLREDLADLTRGGSPLVIRCDLTHHNSDESLSLPTSDPLLSPEAIVDWMSRTADGFAKSGVDLDELAFLPAPLVPARASVMVQARPGAPMVRLDALWGFPDGVGCLPHDSYFHFLGERESEIRRVYKGTCLLWDMDAGWTFRTVPAPFDWAQVLSEEEIVLASRWARQLADHLGQEVQLMSLASVGGRRGSEGMVPWHYTDHEVPTLRRSVEFAPSSGVFLVRGPNELESSDGWPVQGIVFRPLAGEHRDREFVQELGQRAAARGVPVFFEGSILGHTFYLLRSSGAQVITVGGGAPSVRPEDYNKLVRDRIPEIVNEAGGRARVVRGQDPQKSWLLRQKLVEEALEVWRADGESVVEELADLYEVLEAVFTHLDIDFEEVERARLRKREERGGFDRLLFLESTVPDASMEVSPAAGEPSLFERDWPVEPAVGASERGPVEVQENSAQVLFRIPTAPPLRQGLPLKEQQMEIGGAAVNFRFNGSEIEVIVTRRLGGGVEQMQLEIDEE